MRAVAGVLETAIGRPWTAAMPDVVLEAAALLRTGADSVDKTVDVRVTATI